MSYDDYIAKQREAREDALRRFESVLTAGADLNLWHIVPILPSNDRDVAFYRRCHRDVLTDAGVFELSCGNASVEARVAPLCTGQHQNGIRTFPSDLFNPQVDAPTASASLKRDAATIARDLHRRVCVPGAETAKRLAALHAERIAMRAGLIAQIDRMREKGAKFISHRPLDEGAYYDATMWVRGFGQVRVTHDGRVYVERVTVGVDDFDTLRSIVKEA